jgi:acyl-coenzyme A thioesterase PaaI-like protein
VTGRPSSPWSRAGISLEPRGDLENLAGALHGGVAASLLDNALGAAVVECRQVHGQAARPTKSGMANLLG